MHRTLVITLAAAVALAACAETPTSPTALSGAATRSAAPSWAQSVIGTTGEGAQYSVFVPTDWNGDVVYYAHGIKDVAEPIGLPVANNFPAFRDSLGVMGYAIAASSFSENG